ncbi:peptidase M16 [Spirochaetia bacterium]|nr:peptidase M16 [Spirochaetia bacterium]
MLLAALVISCASAPRADFGELGKSSDPVPLMSSAITGNLPNGLRYYILENSRPENRAYLTLAVNAGSVLETDQERGLAHFVEHLAFNDTARFPKLELINYLRSLGMRFGADVNAHTSYDETVYGIEVPVELDGGVKRIPDRALAIIDDWTHGVSFLPEDVTHESAVIIEEYRTRLGAMDRVRKITLPILFSGSRYAQREPIGLPAIIENATAEQLRAFYERWYTGDNMALVFVGDFDGKALEAELAAHFTMPAAEKPVNRPRYDLPPPQKGNFQIEIITDPELTTTDFMIYYKQKPGLEKGTIGYYRQSLIDYLIDVMLSLRFDEASSDPEAASVESWGGVWHWSDRARFYSMGTQAKTGGADAALRELLLAKESMFRYGFTESELSQAKLRLLSYIEEQVSEKDRQNSQTYLRGFTSHFLRGEDFADIEWELEAANRLLPGIGSREIAAAVKDYFSANDCTVFVMAPEAEAVNLPTKERIREIFTGAAKAKIAPKTSLALSGDLLEYPPQPGTISAESADSGTGALIWQLSNGAKIILQETKNKNNEIILYAIARGGENSAADDEYISAKLASEMIGASGLGPYSRTELINKLTGKQVALSWWTANYYRGFQGSSTAKDIKTLFEMLHLGFTQPRLDNGAIRAMLDQYRTNLAQQEENPESVFSREIAKTAYGGHPRFKPLELADINKVSIDQALRFIKNSLNPADYTFVFTGNLNIEELKILAAEYIASIPASTPLNSWTDPGIRRPGKTEKLVYKGKEERSMVYLGWFVPGQAAFSEQRNQTAAILSEYLDILLTDEIREKLGGVYSIYANASVSVIPNGEQTLVVYFYCNPNRVKELIAAVQEQISKVGNQGPDQEIFNKSVEALLKSHENSLQSNSYIAQSYANSSALYNTPLSRLTSRPDLIRAVRPADVQALCREILASGPAQVVLYPEGWAE